MLLPLLAPALPVAVPRFEHVVREPELFVAYRLIDGGPMRDEDPAGTAAFLSALHAVDASALPVERYDWRSRYEKQCQRFRGSVAPLLDRDERRRAEGLFARTEALEGVRTALVHADLGPEHLRCRRGSLVGVIDWGDAVVGDPALDFSWLLHGHLRGDEVIAAYTGPVDDGFRDRVRFYRRLAPWYEADYGLVTGQPERVAAALVHIRARLP